MSKQQYRMVLKSTALIGGSALVNILIGMIRTKFVAALIGPTGVGLVNIYNTMTTPISTFAGMGIATSGVRQIAVANGQGNLNAAASVVTVLRRVVWATGLLGFVLTVAFSPWLSQMTFGSNAHIIPICILGGTILLENIRMGQGCVLQGLRRVSDIAKAAIWGSVNATLISIPCYWVWGVDGVIVSIAICAIASLVVTWFYARRIVLPKVVVSRKVFIRETKGLVGLGFSLMLTGLMSACVNYLLRLIVIRDFDLSGVGIWGAAFNISSILVMFVLNAMGTDYFPRLTSVSHDDGLISEAVNTQAEVALLMAAPGIVATLLFAPIGIHILYTDKFYAAIPILRWSVFGILAKVLAWPFGYIVLAKGRGRLFLGLEIFANIMNLCFTFLGCRYLGLVGTGIAFAGFNVVYLFVILVVSWRLARTCWTSSVLRLAVSVSVVAVASACLHKLDLNEVLHYCLSGIILAIVSWLCIRVLVARTGFAIGLPWKRNP